MSEHDTALIKALEKLKSVIMAVCSGLVSVIDIYLVTRYSKK